MPMPEPCAEKGVLQAGDAAKLAEMLELLNDWLAADHGRLAVSLRDFIGTLLTA